MPSLKMKTQSTTGCLKEKNGLHVCQKSSMIFKSPLSHAKAIRNAEIVGNLIQSSQDASLCKNVPTQSSVTDEANRIKLPEAKDLLLPKDSPSSDCSYVNEMKNPSATCSSDLETIFSPNQEPVDISTDSDDYIDGGCNDLYVPQLETEDSDDSIRGLCKYKMCSVSDFYISDMIVSGLPAESSSIYDDIIATKFLYDYRFDEPSMLFDMTMDYTVIPSLEDTMNNSHARICGVIDSGDSTLYQAIHQLRPCNQESDVSGIVDSDKVECFDPQIFIRNMPELSDVPSSLRPAVLAGETKKLRSITLVLDLDETLVHSTLEPCDDADFTFPVFFNMKEHTVYVKQRPHLRTFLERVAEMFEVVIFTASQSIYAKQLLDILDPDGKLISRRAYRESCIFSDGCYTKDLTVLGVDLAKVFIIDNSPQVFQLQVNNGIPIKSWFNDRSDHALLSLLPLLERLAEADDVRPIIAERFGYKE